jgi:hypothetical protein
LPPRGPRARLDSCSCEEGSWHSFGGSPRLETDLDRRVTESTAAVARLDLAAMFAASHALTDGHQRDLRGPDDFRRR